MKQHIHMSIKDAYLNRHRPGCVHRLADFCWRILLFIALAIIALSLLYGALEISSTGNESGNISNNSNATRLTPKLSKTQLQNTLDEFKKREARFNALKTAAQKIPDPSR